MALIFIVLFVFNVLSNVQSKRETVSGIYDNNLLPISVNDNDVYEVNDELELLRTSNEVRVKLYYECHCPDCRRFDTKQFKEAIIKFGDLIDIKTYPYGNAKMKKRNGKVEIECQHGPAECYGNMLHACALDIIENKTEALLYNSCMMQGSRDSEGSDDDAADKCASNMPFNSGAIKRCAKGDRGTELLLYYGEESKKVNYKYVPYILVNQKESKEENFIEDICNAFTSPPPQCR